MATDNAAVAGATAVAPTGDEPLATSIGAQLLSAVERFEDEDMVALRYRDPDKDEWVGFGWEEIGRASCRERV